MRSCGWSALLTFTVRCSLPSSFIIIRTLPNRSATARGVPDEPMTKAVGLFVFRVKVKGLAWNFPMPPTAMIKAATSKIQKKRLFLFTRFITVKKAHLNWLCKITGTSVFSIFAPLLWTSWSPSAKFQSEWRVKFTKFPIITNLSLLFYAIFIFYVVNLLSINVLKISIHSWSRNLLISPDEVNIDTLSSKSNKPWLTNSLYALLHVSIFSSNFQQIYKYLNENSPTCQMKTVQLAKWKQSNLPNEKNILLIFLYL